MDATAATLSKEGFMTKVEFFSGPNAGEEVYLPDLDWNPEEGYDSDDARREAVSRATEKLDS